MDTTARPDEAEIVLAVDDDDLESQKIKHDKLALKKVTLPKGSTMGTLNTACFEASSGRYVMLINDDVILRTRNWDLAVAVAFARYEDDIALIHVNDLLFREKLCTFPILSRKACLEIGICPAVYKRYAIDDHIYDTYNILAHLGHRRITYLPEVIFEHENFEQLTCEHQTQTASLHIAEDNKVYIPNPEIHEQDASVFHKLLSQRKQDALKLAELIDRYRQTEQRKVYDCLLADVQDPYGYRRSQFVNVSSPTGRANQTGTTTIAVVTSDIYKKHAQRCLAAIKRHTSNFELMILDNNNSGNFVHAREMNKVLRSIDSNFLVLMDDDVFVEEGWLEGLLASMDDETAVIAPMHKDEKGAVSFSGVYLMGDGLGTHAHFTDTPATKRECQCLCSALLLLDLNKCGDLLFDEHYRKYFFDLTHSFKVWEAGYKVVCTPDVVVTHLGGATMKYGSKQSQLLYNKDLKTFIAEWVESGRLARLEDRVWSKYPFVEQLTSIPRRVKRVLDEHRLENFHEQVTELIRLTENYVLFKSFLVRELREFLKQRRSEGNSLNSILCEEMLLRLKNTPWIHTGPIPIRVEFHNGYDLIEWDDRAYAVPVTLDYLMVVLAEERNHPAIITADNVESLKPLIDEILSNQGGVGGKLLRIYWQLIKFDKWALKQRSGGARRLVSWAYREVARRAAVGGYRRLKGAAGQV